MSGWMCTEDDGMGEGGGRHAAQVAAQGDSWAKSAGSEGSGESTGSGGDRDTQHSGCHRKPSAHGLVQTVLSRTDLDPRVLSNSGWGQTPVRQNTTWDSLDDSNGDKKADNGTEAWGSGGGWGGGSGGSSETSSGWAEPKAASGWGDVKGTGGWEEGPAEAPAKSAPSWGGSSGKDAKSSTWNDGQKAKQDWMAGQKGSHGWAAPGCGEWGGEAPRGNQWGEPAKPGSTDSDSGRSGSGSGWSDQGRRGSGNTWGTGGGGSVPNSDAPSGWAEPSKPNQLKQGWGESSKAGWGEPVKPGHSAPSWTDGAKACKSPDWGKPQDPPTGQSSWGVASSQSGVSGTNKPSGWLGGPMPVANKGEECTGWEEPSPESIRRKMEIDDGTAAWGDPSSYKYSSVNMWNKNSSGAGGSEQEGTAGPRQPQAQSPQLCQQPPPTQSSVPSSVPSKDKAAVRGWGDPYGSAQKSESWGELSGPPVSIDNGTSAWGKPMDTGTSWEEPGRQNAGTNNWGGTAVGQQPQHNTGPKPMQSSWCGDEMPMAETRHPSWEEEEEVEIGTWNNTPSQEMNQPGNWSYMKKMPTKVNKGIKQDDGWMNQFVKQFNNMNFPRETSEEILKGNKMEISGGVLSDKRIELEKHVLNVDYSAAIGKGPGTRHHISKESSMDRSPYFDKNVNPVFSGSNAAAQGRATAQPPAQALSSTQPNLRSQVPPPLLSPQVPASLLKYPPNNGGLNPLAFGPQQVAMLSQLSQLNQLSQLSQLQRLLLQQQKVQNQRNMSMGGRQPHDQPGRPLGPVQQMMQPPRHLDASVIKQQQQPMHQPGLKSYLENLLPQNPPELHKEQSTLNSFTNFPLGLNSNLNVNNLDIVGMNYKEPQSRLKKWTALDISVNSPLDQNSSKPGAMSSGLRLEESPFSPYDFINPSESPVSPPGSVGDGWPGRAKSPHGSNNVNWPPEFRPGEPWKGYPNIDPETDPYVTPGSVINNLSINTVRDVDHLRDRNNGSTSSLNTTLPSTSAWSIRASNYSGSLNSTAQSTSARNSDSKNAWSPGTVTNTSLAHELWKVPLPPKGIAAPSRPPPGLTGQKAPPSSWDNSLRLGGWAGSDSRFTPGSSWGDNSSGRTNWLVLKNLTPQIDGSTLRTLCMQHGPLITFHLNLPHGNAVVCYSSKEEAAKAQKSLHMCVLGNTTILADFASEEEISRFFAQGQSMAASPGWQTLGTSQNRMGSMDGSHPFPNRNDPNHWNGAGLAGGSASGDLHGTSLWGGPNYSTSLWGNPGASEGRGISSPTPISSFLPVDHLAGGGDTM